MLHTALVNSNNVLLPPLHVQQEMMKQPVKALNKENDCFRYICEKFRALS